MRTQKYNQNCNQLLNFLVHTKNYVWFISGWRPDASRVKVKLLNFSQPLKKATTLGFLVLRNFMKWKSSVAAKLFVLDFSIIMESTIMEFVCISRLMYEFLTEKEGNGKKTSWKIRKEVQISNIWKSHIGQIDIVITSSSVCGCQPVLQWLVNATGLRRVSNVDHYGFSIWMWLRKPGTSWMHSVLLGIQHGCNKGNQDPKAQNTKDFEESDMWNSRKCQELWTCFGFEPLNVFLLLELQLSEWSWCWPSPGKPKPGYLYQVKRDRNKSNKN